MNNIIEQCSCCLENINDHDNSVTKCGHKFHTSCLNKWIQTGKNTCPLCRGILNNNTQIINKNSNTYMYAYVNRDLMLMESIYYGPAYILCESLYTLLWKSSIIFIAINIFI